MNSPGSRSRGWLLFSLYEELKVVYHMAEINAMFHWLPLTLLELSTLPPQGSTGLFCRNAWCSFCTDVIPPLKRCHSRACGWSLLKEPAPSFLILWEGRTFIKWARRCVQIDAWKPYSSGVLILAWMNLQGLGVLLNYQQFFLLVCVWV